jgi:tRNA/tmRNA/rRNA uracil-C5-methylase (TrmA/RlmC/RlmD family)
MSASDVPSLSFLHPDGRVGGRGPDGRVRWVSDGVVGDTLRGDQAVPDSPHRRLPACPVVERCGGCDLAAWAPEVRRDALGTMVARAYRHDGEVPVLPSPRDEGVRARIKLAIDGGRIGYRRPRSHELVPIDHCPIARPELQPAVDHLAGLRLPEGLASVELRTDGERVVLAFRRSTRDPVELPELPWPVALDGRAVQGDPTLWLSVDGHRLRASPNSFFQVNLEQNEALVRHVRDAVAARSPERLVDLYAGIGNLTVPLAATGVPVVAVELEGQATADLRHNAGDLPITVRTGKVERFDPSTEPFDAAVLDPPRAGAGAVVDRVLRNRPRVVVHVACDPVAGARDVARARKAGYRLVDLRCFDLFPQTHHVETVAVLERR